MSPVILFCTLCNYAAHTEIVSVFGKLPGHVSVGKSTTTPRSLRLCQRGEVTVMAGEMVHSLDAKCEAMGAHQLEFLGFVW